MTLRRRRVMVLGLDHFRPMVARIVEAAGWTPLIPPQTDNLSGRLHGFWHLLRCDVVYYVGGFIRASRITTVARAMGRPVVLHWVGTDILRAEQDLREARVDPLLMKQAVHLAEVQWTQLELGRLGLRAKEVPLTSTRLVGEPTPMPRQFTVLTYLPTERAEFYGQDAILRAAREFPGVRFRVVASQGAIEGAPFNVEWLGYVKDMRALYAESTVLVRLTQHDGLSFMVLEALSAGRHVIWSQPFQHTWHATNYESFRDSLCHMLDIHKAGGLDINTAGAALVKEQYATEVVGQALANALEAAVNPTV